MLSKWRIQGIDGYVFGEDNNLYKLPFESKGKYYELRVVKKQPPNRYYINGQWYSERQLKPLLYKDKNPITLFMVNEFPF
jgi:hypothetical protein